jgi:hypothetical protein
MLLDRLEFRFRYLNRVHYMLDARVQIVKGISSRITEDYSVHRVLWDLDSCIEHDAINSLRKIQKEYDLGKIYILSDKVGSYGAICNNEITFKELLHILIDTDLIDPLFVRYALQRHEAILRMGDKENRPIHRDIICELNNRSYRPYNDNAFYIVPYETGYIKKGIVTGDFYNDQKTI